MKDEIYNPMEGTALAADWFLKRRAPGGKVVHLLNPVHFGALCSAPHCVWQWVPESNSYPLCKKCNMAVSRPREETR